MSVVEGSSVSKSFGAIMVPGGVSLGVEKGGMVAVIGRSGSRKSP